MDIKSEVWRLWNRFGWVLPFALLGHYAIAALSGSNALAFGVLHMAIVPWCIQDATLAVWWLLAVAHGVAHIAHPAFLPGRVPNVHYTPLYDYVVHAAQCLCAFYYHDHDDGTPKGRRWRAAMTSVAIMFHTTTLLAGGLAHVSRAFLQTGLWIALSGGGVYGTHYHMMLLNHTKSAAVFAGSLMLWLAPYLGYLAVATIPQWDSFLNQIGLFTVWYWSYFVSTVMWR